MKSTGIKFLAVMALFVLATVAALTAADSASLESSFRSKCSFCHPLPNPKDYKPEKWAEMVRKMARVIDLSNAEYEYILDLNKQQ